MFYLNTIFAESFFSSFYHPRYIRPLVAKIRNMNSFNLCEGVLLSSHQVFRYNYKYMLAIYMTNLWPFSLCMAATFGLRKCCNLDNRRQARPCSWYSPWMYVDQYYIRNQMLSYIGRAAGPAKTGRVSMPIMLFFFANWGISPFSCDTLVSFFILFEASYLI
jgi:hypothetical protein